MMPELVKTVMKYNKDPRMSQRQHHLFNKANRGHANKGQMPLALAHLYENSKGRHIRLHRCITTSHAPCGTRRTALSVTMFLSEDEKPA
jgi:hypothetical protein